jgi:hypothetical protein
MDEGLRPRRAARTAGQWGSEVARLERGPLADDHWASRMHAEAVETPDDLRHDSNNVSLDGRLSHDHFGKGIGSRTWVRRRVGVRRMTVRVRDAMHGRVNMRHVHWMLSLRRATLGFSASFAFFFPLGGFDLVHLSICFLSLDKRTSALFRQFPPHFTEDLADFCIF